MATTAGGMHCQLKAAERALERSNHKGRMCNCVRRWMLTGITVVTIA